MFLLQIFLPLCDQQGSRFSRKRYEQVEEELINRFQGFTAYSRSPASGLWKDNGTSIQFDELLIYEVMTEKLDRRWWNEYRRTLEGRFSQEKILIRSQVVEVIE